MPIKRRWTGAIRLFGILLSLVFFGCTLSSALAAPVVIATIPLGVSPFAGVTLNPITNRYYVSSAVSNSVVVIDGNTNTVLTTLDLSPYGNRPEGIGVDTGNNRIYVNNFNSNNVVVIDGNTNAVITTLTGFNGPSGLSLNSATHRVYVSNYFGNSVTVLDSTTNVVVATVPVGALPQGSVINPATNRIYVGASGPNVFSVIDGNTNTVIGTLGPGSMVADPVANHLYYATGNTISILDGTTHAVLSSASLGGSFAWWGMDYSAANNRVYMVDNTNNRVLVLDGTTLATLYTVPVGQYPTGANYNPNTNHLFILNQNSNSVSVIADLNPPTLSKAFGVSSIPISGTTSLSFTITNPNQLDTLGGIAFTDNLPAGLVVATPPNVNNNCGGILSAAAGSGTINLSGGTLAANANCSISLDVLGLTAGVKNNVTLPISSTLTGAGNPSNTATLTVVNPAVPTADIQLQKSVDQAAPKVGDSVTFTVSVSNLGPDAASGVQVRDLLPGGLTYLSSIVPTGTTYLAATGDWQVGNLINGQTLMLQITAKVTDDDPITNTATKTGENEYDPNLGNDSASITLQAKDDEKDKDKDKKGKHHPADFSAQLRVSPDRLASIEPSNLISYTFTVKNIGEGRAGQTSLDFPLDSNLEIGYTSFVDLRVWVSAIVTGGTHPHLEISLPSLEVNQVVSGTLVFRPSATAQAGAVIFTRYFIHWGDDERGGKQAGSNAVRFSLSADGTNRDETGGAVQLCLSWGEAVTNNHTFKFKADFYAPKELVTLWYTDKNGVSVLLGTRQADEQGNLSFELVLDDLTAGDTYVIAGLGKRSEVTGSMLITATG